MKKIWIKSATLQDFAEIEVRDWIEGVGMIMSHFEKDFVRDFGHHLTNQSSQPPAVCTCPKPITLEKSYCTECGRDMHPAPTKGRRKP